MNLNNLLTIDECTDRQLPDGKPLINFLDNIITEKIDTLSGTKLKDELELINVKSFNDGKILILTEPKGDIISEDEIIRFKKNYEKQVSSAMSQGKPYVHLVTNIKWYSLFHNFIQNNNIPVYVSKVDYAQMPEWEIEKDLKMTEAFMLPSHLHYYSNEINHSILIDLTLADTSQRNYVLDFEKLLGKALEFDNVEILIRPGMYLPSFENEHIQVIETADSECIHSHSNVFVYSNKPYSNEILPRLLYYAANSKIVFTNYNYSINNLVPSVILNLNKKGYAFSPLNELDAFNILNENRNNVLYNLTLINIIDDIHADIFDKRLVNQLNIGSGNNYMVDNNLITGNDCEQFDSKINSSKYDIEQTLSFPIIFLGKTGVEYNDSFIKFPDKKIDCIIHNQKNVVNKSNQKKKLSMIIPIHNNGKYLKFKCYNSIKQLTCFDDLEIIFVDDGSTDHETLRIIEDIRSEHPEIVYQRFENGSGSASRPRNAGVELASTDYITFLDPDNEAINDGFSVLLEEMEKNQDLDMIVGNIVREDNIKRNEINYYNKVMKVNVDDIIEDTRSILINTNLTVQSIQALIVKRKILLENDLKMVEGAAGQDTLFFQELILNCDKVKVIDQMVHSYYAYVEGSVTNTVTHKFFEKFYKVELQRIKFLEEENLIDVYMKIKFNFYFKNWYLKKYAEIQDLHEKAKAKEYLDKIIELYSPYREYFDVIDY
ncbi:glycosyltransferase [Salinicoccus albus]|uniref:glycosyltransferase n=1 Tax=Salinicoccus albus TaxID=418756 RepID=UPI00036F9D21|nr:glycosyltransferase [Salinicoccus albus]